MAIREDSQYYSCDETKCEASRDVPTYRFPILIWQDHEGFFTANPVEGHFSRYAGIGRAASEAVFQLKEALTYLYNRYPWMAEPDFSEARLIQIKAEVRPEYRIEEQA